MFIIFDVGEEVHELVEVFCDNIDSSVTMPDIGTWVAVRVTAVFNPGHFWVQFPYGTEPIEKRIMAGTLLTQLCSFETAAPHNYPMSPNANTQMCICLGIYVRTLSTVGCLSVLFHGSKK